MGIECQANPMEETAIQGPVAQHHQLEVVAIHRVVVVMADTPQDHQKIVVRHPEMLVAIHQMDRTTELVSHLA
jgi:hypothetical protein